MAQTANAKPSERFAALTAVVLIHALAFALLLYHRGPSALPVPEMGSLKMVALNADPAEPTAPPPPPALPSKVADVMKPVAEPTLATETDADSLAAPAGGCVTLEQVRKAILADSAALASVLNAPPHTRSVAEAIVLWNARWSDSANAIDAPLGATRAAVERSLASVDRGCLDEPIAGPRLVPIPAGTGTMFVVFGSGNWTWREVAENRVAAPSVIAGAPPVAQQ